MGRVIDVKSNFPKSAGRPVDYEAIKRNAYRDHRIAIIDLNDSRIPWPDRELLEQMCKRLYGAAEDAGRRAAG